MYLSFWWISAWVGLNIHMVLLLACDGYLCSLQRAGTLIGWERIT
jgi:hypothetical protein